MWIETSTGCVNSAFVIQIERETDGSILHLSNGTKVKSSSTFDVIDGKLTVIEPDDDDDSIPF